MLRKFKYGIILFFSIVITCGIPILINESYKTGTGYVTLLSPADILSYIGSVIGSIITAVCLVVTILYTKRQIASDRYLTQKKQRWSYVETIIEQALSDVSPLHLLILPKEEGATTNHILDRINQIQSYRLKAKTSLDMIKCHINPHEYTKIAVLVDEMAEFIMLCDSIADELRAPYAAMLDRIAKGENIGDLSLQYYFNETAEPAKRIPIIHGGTYQKLLNMKRDTFDAINVEIESCANQMLSFRNKDTY